VARVQPAPPPPGVLDHLRAYLPDLLTSPDTTPAERKAAIEALICEIRVTEKGLIPVYQIPPPGTTVPGQPADHADTVRTMGGSVGLTPHHANQSILIEGNPLPIRMPRPRTPKAVQ